MSAAATTLSSAIVTMGLGLSIILLWACAPAVPSPTAAPPPTSKPAAAKPDAPAAAPVPATAAPAPPTSKPVAAPAIDTEAMARHFSGKTVTITVGYAPGGGHDTYARILAAHMPRYIPGNPSVAVTNMPGADSLLAARSTIQAPADGLHIGEFHISLVLKSLLGQKPEGFDPEALIFLGNPDVSTPSQQVCVRTEVANSLDAFMKSPRKLKVGETGAGTNPAPLMEWLAVVGLPVEVVYGYGGTAEIRSAFDRKELDLTGRCNDQDVAVLPHWVAEQFATPLFYFGDPAKWVKSAQAEGKFPWYKEALEVVTPTPVQRAVLDTYLSWSGTRTFALPPRTPDPIVATLQKAFADTVNDPTVKDGLNAREYEIGLRTGEDLRRQIREFANVPVEVLTLYKAIHGVR